MTNLRGPKLHQHANENDLKQPVAANVGITTDGSGESSKQQIKVDGHTEDTDFDSLSEVKEIEHLRGEMEWKKMALNEMAGPEDCQKCKISVTFGAQERCVYT